MWVVIFIPGDDGEFPSVCLPQEEPTTLPPITLPPITTMAVTTTTTDIQNTKSSSLPPAYHVHTFTEFWSLPGLQVPDYGWISAQNTFYDPLFYDPLLGDPFLYEQELGWYRSSPETLKKMKTFARSGSVVQMILRSKKKQRKSKSHKKKLQKMSRKRKHKKVKRDSLQYKVGVMSSDHIKKWRSNFVVLV